MEHHNNDTKKVKSPPPTPPPLRTTTQSTMPVPCLCAWPSGSSGATASHVVSTKKSPPPLLLHIALAMQSQAVSPLPSIANGSESQEAGMEMAKFTCSDCRKVSLHKLKKCEGCNEAAKAGMMDSHYVPRYCNVSCQLHHWSIHRGHCLARRNAFLRRRVGDADIDVEMS